MRTIKHHSMIITAQRLIEIAAIGRAIGISTKTPIGFKFCAKIYKQSNPTLN